MDAGNVAGLKQMHFSMYSPEIQRGAILPQQVPHLQRRLSSHLSEEKLACWLCIGQAA